MSEKVNHPPHYGGDTTYEAIKVIEAWGLDFCLGNAIKYICRAGKKSESSELEDLKKAEWYLQRRIKQLSEDKKREEKPVTWHRCLACQRRGLREDEMMDSITCRACADKAGTLGP